MNSKSSRFVVPALFAAILAGATLADPPAERPKADPAVNVPRGQDLQKLKQAPGTPAPQPCPPPNNEDRSVSPGFDEGGESSPQLLGIEPADSRLKARGEGFVTVVREKTGDLIVAFDHDGKNGANLAQATVGLTMMPAWNSADGKTPLGGMVGQGKIESWWLSPDGKVAAWTTALGLFAASTDGGAAQCIVMGATAYAPGFSPDGKQIALVDKDKLALYSTDGKTRTLLETEGSLVVARGPAVYSPDGKRVFCLVAASQPGNPDGIGAADLTAGTPVVKALFETSQSRVVGLNISPDGKWLAFQQSTQQSPMTFRLYATDGSEFRAIARSSEFSEPAFAPDGQHVFFAAPGANGVWTVWEAGLVADEESGEIPVRRLFSTAKFQVRTPALSADGSTLFVLAQNMEGNGREVVGRLKLK